MGYSCQAAGYQTVSGQEKPQSQVCPDISSDQPPLR